MGNHIVIFTFDNKLEVDTILSNEPQSFDKHLMVLQHYDKDMSLDDLLFNLTSFQVQVHRIPMRFMNQRVVEGICNTIGNVIRPTQLEEEGGSFLKVRINSNITRSLSRGRMASMGQGKEQWVSFKYEHLPNLYYWCECLTHDDRDCEIQLDSEGTLATTDQQFGPWIRVQTLNFAHMI